MFERPQNNSQAVLVSLDQKDGQFEPRKREFAELAISAGVQVLSHVEGVIREPNPKYFAGSGKVDEITESVRLHDAGLVIFDHALSPSQERNLEKRLCCRVLDRSGLILDIFAQRARSHEGKLQVELAQLEHLSTRLVRGWTHLERQKGGIGLRGPGETQLETDRRLIGGRIKNLKKRLQKLRVQRDIGRRSRQKAELPVISLVGYTNAGKSTLFNRLTESNVYSENQLFATLDTTLRRVRYNKSGNAILADTVGFISDLPHELVEAFHATLEETVKADLLIHIVDASDPQRRDMQVEVNRVLESIDAREIPQIMVYNKIDKTEEPVPRVHYNDDGLVDQVHISAKTGAGCDLLLKAVEERLRPEHIHARISLPATEARLRSRLFDLGAIENEEISDSGEFRLLISLPVNDWHRLCDNEEIPFKVQQSVMLAGLTAAS